MLDLRQSSKSVKYMTANEREEAKERLEKQERYEKLVQVWKSFPDAVHKCRHYADDWGLALSSLRLHLRPGDPSSNPVIYFLPAD